MRNDVAWPFPRFLQNEKPNWKKNATSNASNVARVAEETPLHQVADNEATKANVPKANDETKKVASPVEVPHVDVAEIHEDVKVDAVTRPREPLRKWLAIPPHHLPSAKRWRRVSNR